MEPLLARNLAIKKDRKLSGEDLQKIMVDITEINTQRPAKNQRKYYSGKKKRHTQKIEVQTDEKGKIISVSKAYGGRKHSPFENLKNQCLAMQSYSRIQAETAKEE
jgi:hypothetical protein